MDAKSSLPALDLFNKPSRPFSSSVKTGNEVLYTREVVLCVFKIAQFSIFFGLPFSVNSYTRHMYVQQYKSHHYESQ